MAGNGNQPIYAVAPINVGGTLYDAGDEIDCGEGARRSLLRFEQATTTKPGQSRAQSSNDDPPPVPAPNEGDTPIDVLELEAAPAKAAEKYFVTVEQIEQFVSEHKLSVLPGIGEPTEKKILAAVEAYRAADEE